MTGRVLVIDDDRAIARLTSLVLESAGYGVDLAFDGRTGIARAEQATPDAIVLDLRLPDLEGFEVAALLSENPALAVIPIIILSANVQEQVRMRAAAAGVAAFIAKPYERQRLLKAVDTALTARPSHPFGGTHDESATKA